MSHKFEHGDLCVVILLGEAYDACVVEVPLNPASPNPRTEMQFKIPLRFPYSLRELQEMGGAVYPKGGALPEYHDPQIRRIK